MVHCFFGARRAEGERERNAMRAFAKDLMTVVHPERRRAWKANDADLRNQLRLQKGLIREYKSLAELPIASCQTANLSQWDTKDFSDYIGDPARSKEWEAAKHGLTGVSIPEMTGGVNHGDQRLIYHLIRYLQPRNVLETGTHIGASTFHIAAALSEGSTLTTVDIRDVNDINSKPWLNAKSEHSPKEMLQIAGLGERVDFQVSDSVAFLKTSRDSFDFIFLDGDHAAKAVYQEVPLALKRLSENGVILLHDFFPNLEPLWPDESFGGLYQTVVPGPFIAIQRFEREEVDFAVIPFGELPWPTKLGTNITSLAVLVRGE